MRPFHKILVAAAVLAAPTLALASSKETLRGASRLNAANPSTERHINRTPTLAEADYTFSPFTLNVAGPVSNAGATLLTGLPAGTWTNYTVTLEWGGSVGDAWSSEAIWALTDAPLATAVNFYADPGVSPDAFDDPFPATLTWSGEFDIPYTTGSTPLYFLSAQTFGGSSATWSDITITLNDDPILPPEPPTAIQTFVGGSLSVPLAAGEIEWFEFDYSGSGALSFDTLGNTLSGGSFPSDTEIALYDAAGNLIDTNDDINFGGGIYSSSLSFADGELPAGTYYLAAGGWDLVFNDEFLVDIDSTQAGTLVINGLSIPEPTTLGLLAATGLLVARRRRA